MQPLDLEPLKKILHAILDHPFSGSDRLTLKEGDPGMPTSFAITAIRLNNHGSPARPLPENVNETTSIYQQGT